MPEPLTALIAAMLEKSRDRRPASMFEVADALRRMARAIAGSAVDTQQVVAAPRSQIGLPPPPAAAPPAPPASAAPPAPDDRSRRGPFDRLMARLAGNREP